MPIDGTPDTEFIRTAGTQFTLGQQPFHIRGANNYYLGFASDAMVQPLFDLARQMRVNTLRTWAFLDCGSAPQGYAPANAQNGVFFHYWNETTGKPDFNDGSTGLERLDRTIALAEQHGIRLILPLVNYWDDFGGVNQYLQWFGLSDRALFYREASLKDAYRNYVEHLLLRVNTRTGRQYRDEPSILAWELANEPRCVTTSGTPLRHGVDMLLEWIAEMSAFIKSLDPNHLVAAGDEGYFKQPFAFRRGLYNGSLGVDCERILAIPDIDFGTCHLYPAMSPDEPPADFGVRWIREHLAAGARAGKPMLLEEYGLKNTNPAISRDATFQLWLDQVTSGNGAGALLWMIAASGSDGRPYPDYDGYTVYSPGEIPSVIGIGDEG